MVSSRYFLRIRIFLLFQIMLKIELLFFLVMVKANLGLDNALCNVCGVTSRHFNPVIVTTMDSRMLNGC